MTPDSPVGGLIRLNFSQDNIKFVSRVFGTQVLCSSFQPFGRSRRLCTAYPIVSPQFYIKMGLRGGTYRCARAARSGVGLGGRLDTILRSLRYLTGCLRWRGRVGIIPRTSPVHLDLFHKRRF